jgi:hypothetical protein
MDDFPEHLTGIALTKWRPSKSGIGNMIESIRTLHQSETNCSGEDGEDGEDGKIQ